MQHSSILGTLMLRRFYLFNWYGCSNFGYFGTLGILALGILGSGILDLGILGWNLENHHSTDKFAFMSQTVVFCDAFLAESILFDGNCQFHVAEFLSNFETQTLVILNDIFCCQQ